MLLMSAPESALQIGGNTIARKTFGRKLGVDQRDIPLPYEIAAGCSGGFAQVLLSPWRPHTHSQIERPDPARLIGPCCGRACAMMRPRSGTQVLAATPMERLKVLQQIGKSSGNLFKTVADVGLGGLYAGWTACMFRDVLFGGVCNPLDTRASSCELSPQTSTNGTRTSAASM